jgi:hypothetical protein
MGGEYYHHGIIIVEIEGPVVQIKGEEHYQKSYYYAGYYYLKRHFIHQELFAPQIDTQQIERIHGNRLLNKKIIPSDNPSFHRINYVKLQIKPVSSHVENNSADQNFHIGGL